MAITTQYEFLQATAKHIVEVGGQPLASLTYTVADNTVILPARGAVSVPLKTAMDANLTIEAFCQKVIEAYRPPMFHTQKIETSAERKAGPQIYKAKASVNLDQLSDFTVLNDGIIQAAARDTGPVKFPEFVFVLRFVTRTFQYIDASLRGKTAYLRELG